MKDHLKMIFYRLRVGNLSHHSSLCLIANSSCRTCQTWPPRYLNLKHLDHCRHFTSLNSSQTRTWPPRHCHHHMHLNRLRIENIVCKTIMYAADVCASELYIWHVKLQNTWGEREREREREVERDLLLPSNAESCFFPHHLPPSTPHHYSTSCIPSGDDTPNPRHKRTSLRVRERDSDKDWSVSEFRRHWTGVLEECGVPEPVWSVKWILEHVMRGGGGGRSMDHVTQSRNLVIHKRSEMKVSWTPQITYCTLGGCWCFNEPKIVLSSG